MRSLLRSLARHGHRYALAFLTVCAFVYVPDARSWGALVAFLLVLAFLLLTPLGRRWHAFHRSERPRLDALEAVETALTAAAVPFARPLIKATPWGWLIELATPRGSIDQRTATAAPVLAAALQAQRVTVEPVTRAGAVRFRVVTIDPLAEVPALAPSGEPTDLVRPAVVGVAEDGQPVQVPLWSSTVLVGGSPGSGKSVFGWLLIAHAALDPTTVLVLLDLKPSGIETAPAHGRADYRAHTSAEALAVLTRLWALVEQRNAELLARGLEKVPTNDRATFPPVVVIVDEAAELDRSGDDDGKAALLLLTRLVAVGRASGISVVLMTQKPSGTVLPTDLRDLFAQRVAFRVGNRPMAETVLGPLADGVRPWEVSSQSPGVGYAATTDGVQRRFRAAYLDREGGEVSRLMAQAEERRNVWRTENGGVEPLPQVSVVLRPEKPRTRRQKAADAEGLA